MAEETMQDRQRQLVAEYAELRNAKTKLEAELRKINIKLKGTEEEPGGIEKELTEFMSDANLKTVKFDDIGSVTLMAPKPRPSYEKELEDQVFQFVREQGGDAIIKPTIHPSTFSSFVGELLAKGIPMPEYLQIFYQPSLKFTPKKGE